MDLDFFDVVVLVELMSKGESGKFQMLEDDLGFVKVR